MKIAIVNTLPVPSGNASVNRFLGYGKELVRLGLKVDVLSSANFKSNIVDGVNNYSCGNGKSMISALISILNSVMKGKYDAIILVSNSLFLIYPLFLVCKLCKIKFLQEKSEFPFVLMKKGSINKIFATFYTKTTYRLFDGLIIMTKPLMMYFKDKVRKECKLLEMPMTVDTERFMIDKTSSEYGKYIAYCGNMSGNKDGVLNLIESFNIASNLIPDVNLLLIGGSSNEDDWKKIVATVKNAQNPRIILYGRASRDEIPYLLKNAHALALARPSSLQSTGGFPTKLGEYLATGNPVVVTAVGDIPQYLNESNSYIVAPDDNDLFSKALVNVFKNYSVAVIKGHVGQGLAKTTFSSEYQAARLYKYLISL